MLFDKNKAPPTAEINELRQQGLTDEIITEELSKKGFPPEQIQQALAQTEPLQTEVSLSSEPGLDLPSPEPTNDMGNMYERIEEITESMSDERWDDLIIEVKKIIDWKEKVEEKQTLITNDLQKLKEDFKVLHQGVLGKLEDYDTRMQDVGTELKAVGKVFKDVIPTFVENVKELKAITKK